MTDGERAIWAAAFTRRLLDRTAKPPDHACSSTVEWEKWRLNVAMEAAGAASDVLLYARLALDGFAAHGEGFTTRDLREMLGVPAPGGFVCDVTDGCSRCSGDYCDTHGGEACDCLPEQRHGKPSGGA